MNLVHSKDIYYIFRDVMRCLDPKVMNHGARTSYILYRMLQCMDKKYEMYELAEFAFLATLHDLGAYKTDYMKDQLGYETKEYMPHSIYGYLFLLYLTPFKDRAKIVLYHHTDFTQVPKTNYEYDEIIHCLNVAEKMDLFSNILGGKFDYMMFQKQAGTKYSPKALDLLYQAEKKYDVFSKLSSGEYKRELAELYEYLIFTDEEKRDFLVGLMYIVGFRSEYTMLDSVTCVQVAQSLGERLMISDDEKEILFYATLLHDAGMCAISRDISEAPRKLTDEEMQTLRTHVEVAESILKGRIDEGVLEVILAHHERCDGSGYPKHLKSNQLNRLMRILQVADTITGLTNPRSYRDPKPANVVVSILKEEAEKGKLSKEVVRIAVNYYDDIMAGVKVKTDEMLAMYRKLQDNYEITYKQTKQ